LKKQVKAILAGVLPPSWNFKLFFFYHRIRGGLDKEMLMIGPLLKSKRRFLDIGANSGYYSYYFQNVFNKIDAFEPLLEITKELESVAKDSITFHHVALSDRGGEQIFFLPLDEDGEVITGLASLERREGVCHERVVPIRCLDDYGFTDVDLIKVDVEGHELKVLAGSRETIKISKPLLIIEIEQRHLQMPIIEIFNQISLLGYQGFFLDADKWVGLEAFSFECHQKPYLDCVWDPRYVNNFVFVPV
jgi:FkbM family methyltransferase